MQLARRGWKLNHKRLYRLYRDEHLAVRRLRRKQLVRPAMPVAEHYAWLTTLAARPTGVPSSFLPESGYWLDSSCAARR